MPYRMTPSVRHRAIEVYYYYYYSSYRQNINIKSHIGFQKKLKYLTFDDPEKSRSLTEILDAEYLVNGMR